MKKFIFLLIVFVFIDAFLIEPNIIQVKQYNLKDEKIKNLKVVFISDLHLKKNQRFRLDKIVAKINNLNPDILLSTGDFFYSSDLNSLDSEIIAKSISQVKTKYGIYTVLGNHDCINDEIYLVDSFRKYNITVLQNDNVYINNLNLYIAGIEDDSTRNPNLSKALSGTKNPRVLLMHSPDYYDKLYEETSLVLAGHNHNGQICLPVIGPLFLPSKTKRKYKYGFYTDNFKKMIVTKGLGNSVIDARLNCLPEIVVINFE